VLSQYLHIFLFALIGLAFACSILVVAALVRPFGAGKKDLSAYECGMDGVGAAWVSPNIRFYVFALLFVIFDVEALFVFPWAVQFKTLGVEGFIAVLIFAAILFLGLIYAWRKGALKWE
jgi:NADH:ubiquinone oxidoreductase subunit 3 (subunit A)